MKYAFYQHGHGMNDQRADAFFVGNHAKRCSKNGKPSQDAVIFFVEHIKNADCAGNPEQHILQRNEKITVSDQTAQY